MSCVKPSILSIPNVIQLGLSFSIGRQDEVTWTCMGVAIDVNLLHVPKVDLQFLS